MIAIIDYGVGNLFSLSGSLKKLGIDSIITSDPEKIASADRIILPGVGAFGDAAARLASTGLDKVIKAETVAGKPLLGICLGMQLLFDKSFEYGEHEGLGLIKGEVRPIEPELKVSLKIPHIGWNALRITDPSDPILKYSKNEDYVYFVHSFYAANCEESISSTAEYGITITASVKNGNVYGTQFHPEKSGNTGLKILKAFSEI